MKITPLEFQSAEKKADYLTGFTKLYQRLGGEDINQREAALLSYQLPFMLSPMKPGDLLAGRIYYPPLLFTTQVQTARGGFGFVFNADEVQPLIDSGELSGQQRRELEQLSLFWSEEDTAVKVRQAYPEEMRKLLPSDAWTEEPGIAFPLYRMAGSTLDYGALLELGVSGLRKRIEEKRTAPGDDAAVSLYDAMDSALHTFSELCEGYAGYIEQEHSGEDTFDKKELQTTAAILRRVATEPPATFREAVQLSFFYSVVSGSLNYGRIDVYLGSFLARDLENGTLDWYGAKRIFGYYWRLMNARETIFDGRVILGGKGRPNERDADLLAMLALETAEEIHDVLPQLTLRFYDGQDTKLYDRALELLGAGNTYPILYNDDVNIPAVAEAFAISGDEAVHYIPYGCGEYTIEHKSYGTPSGVINLLKALEVVLFRGNDPVSGQPIGTKVDYPEEYGSFEELYAAYKAQVEKHVEVLAAQEDLEYRIAAQTGPFLYISILYDDCIGRGKAVFDGGIRYLGGTLETYGNTNTADSLLAIQRLVFDEKRFTLDELREMIRNDFKGYEVEQELLLGLPKYGNDNSEADEMLLRVHNHVCEHTRKQRENTGLHSYLVVNINNNANTVLGRHTAASPDGRNAGKPMANGNTPAPGMDQSGLTALLNSIIKPPINMHAGATQNLKFSKELFRDYRDKIKLLLKVYWARGGAQAMITVVGAEDLQRAMERPEEYGNLLVRVGGFTARFIDLDRDVQEEILKRTLYA